MWAGRPGFQTAEATTRWGCPVLRVGEKGGYDDGIHNERSRTDKSCSGTRRFIAGNHGYSFKADCQLTTTLMEKRSVVWLCGAWIRKRPTIFAPRLRATSGQAQTLNAKHERGNSAASGPAFIHRLHDFIGPPRGVRNGAKCRGNTLASIELR